MIGLEEEFKPSILTLNNICDRNDLLSLISVTGISSTNILWSSPKCQTRSNATQCPRIPSLTVNCYYSFG